MKVNSRNRTFALAIVACSGLLITASAGKAQRDANESPRAATASLEKFLQTLRGNKTTRYASAFRDLDGDGVREAIVYLMGDQWCGTGGCDTLILTPDGSSWRIIANITITRPPIYVLANVSSGWRSIGVWVEGGGIHPGYEAELRFDGKTYPKNPSIPPAQPLVGKPIGEMVIASTRDATLLHDD